MAAPTARYEVRVRIQGSGQAWRVYSFPADSTVVTIPDLNRGTAYEGEARAVGYQGEASIWVPVTFSVGMPSYVPKPPQNMVVLPSPNGVTVQWEVGEGNRPDTVYEVWQRPPGGEWAPVGETSGNSIYIPVSDDQEYEWKVLAKNFQDAMSEYTALVTAARQHVADQVDLAQEIADRIQGDADEALARAEGDAAEALARSEALLELETDVTAAINAEKILRENGDENLASMIANVSAGSGEQFDSDFIWYFNTDAEGWTQTTGSAPTVTDGYLKPADNSVPGGVQSPVFDGDGTTYRNAKLRAKQTGNPTWTGYLWWQTDSDATYTTGKRVAIPEPVWDTGGVATIDFKDVPWASDINRIRIDLTSTQDATNFIAFDWIAVGRPSPGASLAALQEEQTARISADAAEAVARQNLASQMRGSYTGNDLALVTTGLIADEKNARTTADSAEVTAREALSVKVTGLADPSGATLPTLSSGLLYDERTARSTADSAMASDITALDVRLDNAEGTISSQSTALSLLTTRVTDVEGVNTAQGTAITNLQGSITTKDFLAGSGVNLLPDEYATFEKATLPPMLTAGAVSVATARDAAITWTGKGSLKTTIGTTTGNGWVALSPGSNSNYNIPITSGRSYLFSVYVRSDVASCPVQLYAYTNAGETLLLGNFNTSPTPGTWTRICGKITPNNSATAMNVRVDNDSATSGTNVWFDGAMVEENLGGAANPQPSAWSRGQAGSVSVANANAISALDVRLTSAEGTLTSQASSITSLSTDVSTVKNQLNNLPGDNVLANSSFDGETVSGTYGPRPQYWNIGLGGTGTGTGLVSSLVDSPLTGSTKALRCAITALAATRYVEVNINNTETGGFAKVTPGRKHTLSANIRGKVGNSFQMYIQYRDSANSPVATVTLPSTPLTDTFTRYAITGNAAPTNAVQAQIYAVRMFGTASEADAWFEIDNVMFCEGEGVGSYMPGVNVLTTALASAISALDVRVTANEASITAQASQITNLAASITARGVNLLPDPWSFFDPAASFTISGVAGGTAARSTEQTYLSGASVKMVSSTTDNYFFFGNGSQYLVTLQPGKKYLLSLFQRSSVANAQLQGQVVAANSENRFFSFPVPTIPVDTWGRSSVVIDLSTGFTATAWKLRIDNHAASGVTTYIDGIMVEELLGTQTVPSAYSRGGSQVQIIAQGSAIQTLDTRVTATESATSSNSSAITQLQSSVAGAGNLPLQVIRKGVFEDGSVGGWGNATAVSVSSHPTRSKAMLVSAGSYEGAGLNGATCQPGDVFDLSCDLMPDQLTGPGASVNFGLAFHDKTGALISQPGAISRAPAAAGWVIGATGTITAPANAAFVRGVIFITTTGAGAYVNNLSATKRTVGDAATVTAMTALTTRVTQVEGSGNPNLLVNSSYNADLNGWSQAGAGIVLWARDAHGPTWQPPGMHTLVIGLDNNAATGTWAAADSRAFGVEPGKTYIASSWLAAHRATIVGVQIIFADASGATILVPDNRGVVGGAGQNIADPAQWTRRYVVGVAPANARTAYVRVFFFKDAGTTSTPYLWILRPMLELARPNQTTPTDWGTGGFEMMASYVLNLDVNGYAAGFKVANDGTTSNFIILSDYFAVVKPGGGPRLEWSGGNQRVYDGAGTLRVRVGVW